MKPKSKVNVKRMLIGIIILIMLIICGSYIVTYSYNKLINRETTMYLASTDAKVTIYDMNYKELKQLIRGTKINIYQNKNHNNDNIEYYEGKIDKKTIYVRKDNLVLKKSQAVLETNRFVRTATTILKDLNTSKIVGSCKKGDELKIIGYDTLLDTGEVNRYKINYNDTTGYVYSKYLVKTKDESLLNYEPEKYYTVHEKLGDTYGGGSAGNLDYYPNIKPTFKDNVMPETVYALYLNNGSNVINSVDSYIEFAKTTKINAFVVDIKDNTTPGYNSKVMETYSPTNFKHAINDLAQYQTAIKKIKDAGFYVVGRITTFKDSYFMEDHPEYAIKDSRTGKPFNHNNSYWPSAFRREVWEFNVELAKEAVTLMGFNEIQFDYVRFPDRTYKLESQGQMDLNNIYDEEKAQAIQTFLQYACDELHQLNVYVSADVFGESAYNYVTAYGQYWPAISNVVDVISAMPYPDHFNDHDFGISELVWTVPGKLIDTWAGNYTKIRQTEIPTPAIARTWVQAYDAIRSPYNAYNSEEVKAQINALYNNNLTGGYMTWNSASSLAKYKLQKDAYNIDYWKR